MKEQVIEIYHNNRCSKSRAALEQIQNSGKKYLIIDYLKNPPTTNQLKTVLAKLGVSVTKIIREKEKLFTEKYKGKSFTDEEWIQILCENPILIERPLVIDGHKAIVARQPDLLEELLNR